MHTSLRFEKIKPKHYVKTGKGKGSKLERDKWCTVTKTDPLECVLVKFEGPMSNKELLPSKERYCTHWKQDDKFDDSIAWHGFSMDGIIKQLDTRHGANI